MVAAAARAAVKTEAGPGRQRNDSGVESVKPRANHRPPALTTTMRDRKHMQVVMNYGFAKPYMYATWAKVASAADCRGGGPTPSGGGSCRPVKRM